MEHLLSLLPIPFLPTFTPVSLLINFCPQSRFPIPILSLKWKLNRARCTSFLLGSSFSLFERAEIGDIRYLPFTECHRGDFTDRRTMRYDSMESKGTDRHNRQRQNNVMSTFDQTSMWAAGTGKIKINSIRQTRVAIQVNFHLNLVPKKTYR